MTIQELTKQIADMIQKEPNQLSIDTLVSIAKDYGFELKFDFEDKWK